MLNNVTWYQMQIDIVVINKYKGKRKSPEGLFLLILFISNIYLGYQIVFDSRFYFSHFAVVFYRVKNLTRFSLSVTCVHVCLMLQNLPCVQKIIVGSSYHDISLSSLSRQCWEATPQQTGNVPRFDYSIF